MRRKQHRIIPPEEDMRRLFQECKIGQGNANLLSEALRYARPEDLVKKDIIKVFALTDVHSTINTNDVFVVTGILR